MRVVSEKRIAALNMLGGKCEMCGNDDLRVLQIDHKFDDGGNMRGGRNGPKRSSSFMVKGILSGRFDLSRLRALCSNCHVLRTLYGIEE